MKRYPVSRYSFVSSTRSKIREWSEAEIGAEADISVPKAEAEKIARIISSNIERRPYVKGVDTLDSITRDMWGRICSAAEMFLKKAALGSPIVVRFHNDIDGASGAYALFSALKRLVSEGGWFDVEANIKWIMNKGVYYRREDAISDAMLARDSESVSKPLLFIIDFGTATASNPGIEEALKTFDMIWLDHHPLQEGFNGKFLENYINPWSFGGDSNYTAGFLSCAFSHSFSDEDTAVIEDASLMGDYSDYSKPTAESERVAAILDIITSDPKVAIGRGIEAPTPEHISSILSDQDKSSALYFYATSKMSEMVDRAIPRLKKTSAGNAKIYTLDFEPIKIEETRYPLPGRFGSRLLSEISQGKGAVLVLYSGPYISVRVTKDMSARLKLLQIISSIKESEPDVVEDGGGHEAAASIKLRDKNFRKEVAALLIKRIKDGLG